MDVHDRGSVMGRKGNRSVGEGGGLGLRAALGSTGGSAPLSEFAVSLKIEKV